MNERDRSTLRAAFENAPFEVWMRDAEGRCIVQNAAARKWGPLLGKLTEESGVPPGVLAIWEANNRRAYAGELVQGEFEAEIGGEKHSYECVVVPLREDGVVQGIVGFNIDISARRQAEMTLQQSEWRLRKALEVSRMGYVDWNLVTHEMQWSPETYRIFGHAPGGAFSPSIESVLQMVPPDDRTFVRERLDAVIHGTADYDVVHRVVRADGQVSYVHARGEVMRDERGKPLRMLGTFVDVTERKLAEIALRRSEEHLKQALDAASAGTWDWNIRTGEMSWSNEIHKLYNFDQTPSFEEWAKHLHPDDAPRMKAAVQDALEGRTAEYRAEFRVPYISEVRWVLGIGQVKRDADGSPTHMTGISVDITERKRAEEELQEVDRRRTEFLGVLSHELRNPLAPIRNSLFILGRAAPGSEPARRALNVIGRQVDHLSRLVDDLLDLTRITSGKIRLQKTRVDLVRLIRATVEDHRTLMASHEIRLNLPDEAVWVQGDWTRLAQVLGNLFSNAAKFTPASGTVSISVLPGRSRVVVEVADTGVGIDGETLARLFIPFSQADRSLHRSRGGLGLGLALVKQLVEMHGGAVSARSEGPQRGACFRIELPLDAPEGDAPKASAPRAAEPGRRRVLVIEDNKDAAETLAMGLELLGYDVSLAFDGTTGVARARELDPDVILCDIGLPGELDGYGVARAVRRDPALARAYRIALTGYARPEDRRMTKEAGFDAHVAKPVDLDQLEELIASAAGAEGLAAGRPTKTQ